MNTFDQTLPEPTDENELPLEDSIKEMLDILNEFQIPDTAVQQNTLQKLEDTLYYPDTNFCLVSILTRLKTQPEPIRLLSGFILKNNIKNFRSNLQYEVLEFIMKECLNSIGDPSRGIRQIIGNIISTISSGKKIEYWTQPLEYICSLIDSNDSNQQDGAFTTLQKILEDSTDELESPLLNQLLDFLLPKLLDCLKNSDSRMRLQALQVARPILIKNPSAANKYIGEFVVNIAFLMNDHEKEINLHSCRLLASLVESQSQYLVAVFKPLVNVMLKAYENADDSEMALAAAEFFLYASDQDYFKDILGTFFPSLLPVIIKNICLDEGDSLMYLENDFKVRDCEEDVKPSLYDYFPENDEEEMESDTNGGESYEWTLRNCSADILSNLSAIFKDDCFPIILPVLNEAFCHANWIYNECGLVALSAIAKGCQKGMRAYLPSLFHFLIVCLSHERIQFRLASCTVFGCYANWLVTEPKDLYLEPTLTVLMERLRDSNKMVQNKACLALLSIIEECGEDFVPYLLTVLQNIQIAFANYQKNNLISLYKLLRTIADKLVHHLNRPEYISIIMPILTSKWNTLKDNDKELLPLMGCLKNMAKVMKADFLPCCEGIFNKCLRLIENTIDEEVFYINQLTFDRPHKDFKVAPLDLIATIVEVNGERIQALIAKRKILHLVHICTLDLNTAVKNSSFNLLFQLTKVSNAYAQKFAADFFPILATSLDPNSPELCVSACRTICELAFKLGPATVDCLDFVLDQFLRLIDNEHLDKTILKSILICLGYLGYVCPTELAPYLSYFANQWFNEVQYMRGIPETDLAFQGYCFLITLNPQAIVTFFMEFCLAAASLENPSPVLREMIYKIWCGFTEEIPAQDWLDFTNKLPNELVDRLYELYRIQK